MIEKEKRPRFSFNVDGPITFYVTGPAIAVLALLTGLVVLLITRG